METPKYKHDCESCTFLGHYKDHDLYYCNEPFVKYVARFSDEGPDYVSGNQFARKDGIEELYRAKILYGHDFLNRLTNWSQHYMEEDPSKGEGQAYMSALYLLNEPWHTQIAGTEDDPSEDDSLLPEFLLTIMGYIYET